MSMYTKGEKGLFLQKVAGIRAQKEPGLNGFGVKTTPKRLFKYPVFCLTLKIKSAILQLTTPATPLIRTAHRGGLF